MIFIDGWLKIKAVDILNRSTQSQIYLVKYKFDFY